MSNKKERYMGDLSLSGADVVEKDGLSGVLLWLEINGTLHLLRSGEMYGETYIYRSVYIYTCK